MVATKRGVSLAPVLARWALTALAGALLMSAPAASLAQGGDPIRVYGAGPYGGDFKALNYPAVKSGFEAPPIVKQSANDAWRKHQKIWETPPVPDTYLDGKPVVFWLESDAPGGKTANWSPFSLIDKSNGHWAYALDQAEKETVRRLLPDWRDSVCAHPGGKNWCEEDKNSSMLFTSNLGEPWTLRLLWSHEFVHLKQNRWFGMTTPVPHWITDGMANGWGFGIFEDEAGYDRVALAKRLATHRKRQLFGFYLGLRYYDQPLDLHYFKYAYPRRHPDYPVTEADPGAHVKMAGYMSGSFFRYMALGRPQGWRAAEAMTKAGPPSQSTAKGWLDWLDEGIRRAVVKDEHGNPVSFEGKPVRVWPGGIRQIYAEMIADLADFPDTGPQSRVGELGRVSYDARLWSKGCNVVDLQTQARSLKLRVPPLAAHCVRVRAPPPTVMRGAPRFVVTASSVQPKACADLQLASRGKVMQNPTLLIHGQETDKPWCTISWVLAYDPLRPQDPQGLQGYQTVLLVNAADKATASVRRDVTLDFSQPVLEGSLFGAATPESAALYPAPVRDGFHRASYRPGSGPALIWRVSAPARRTLPALATRELQPIVTPMTIRSPADDPAACAPEALAILECGPVTSLSFTTGDMARMAGVASGLLDGELGLRDSTSSWARPSYDEPGHADLIGRMSAGQPPRGSLIKVILPALSSGQTGTFPARVVVEWSDGTRSGTGVINSLGPLGPQWDEAGCNAGSPPTQGTVVISANNPGFIVGSFSARLYEANRSDDPGEVCRRPFIEVGTIQASFVTVGDTSPLQSDGGGTSPDTVWHERYAEENISLAMQLGKGMVGGARPASPWPGATSPDEGAGMLRGACPAQGDVEAFIQAQMAPYRGSGIPAAGLKSIEAAFRAMSPADLAASACAWIAQRRPQ